MAQVCPRLSLAERDEAEESKSKDEEGERTSSQRTFYESLLSVLADCGYTCRRAAAVDAESGRVVVVEDAAPTSSSKLQLENAFPVDETELQRLLVLIERLATESGGAPPSCSNRSSTHAASATSSSSSTGTSSTYSGRLSSKERWAVFKHQLETELDEGYDCVLDGANIGHWGQNFSDGRFSLLQIRAMVAQLRQQKRKPLIIIREHWLLKETEVQGHLVKAKRRKLAPLEMPNGEKVGTGTVEKTAAEVENGVDVIAAEPETDQRPAAAEASEVVPNKIEDEEVSSTATTTGPPPPGPPQQALSVETLQERVRPLRLDEWQPLGLRWREERCLLVAPAKLNDDWIFLYVAVYLCLKQKTNKNINGSCAEGEDGSSLLWLVSNDLMRDHFFRMRQHPSLLQWRDQHLCKYGVGDQFLTSMDEEVEIEDRQEKEKAFELFTPRRWTPSMQKIHTQEANAHSWVLPFLPSALVTVSKGKPGGNGEARGLQPTQLDMRNPFKGWWWLIAERKSCICVALENQNMINMIHFGHSSNTLHLWSGVLCAYYPSVITQPSCC
ncbi:unnamed protein product [Amoebophrya sp. A25]|nr:unnamed protein product [Amoebophrya sp. A25]|eukprot:GSA25T00008984001.1